MTSILPPNLTGTFFGVQFGRCGEIERMVLGGLNFGTNDLPGPELHTLSIVRMPEPSIFGV